MKVLIIGAFYKLKLIGSETSIYLIRTAARWGSTRLKSLEGPTFLKLKPFPDSLHPKIVYNFLLILPRYWSCGWQGRILDSTIINKNKINKIIKNWRRVWHTCNFELNWVEFGSLHKVDAFLLLSWELEDTFNNSCTVQIRWKCSLFEIYMILEPWSSSGLEIRPSSSFLVLLKKN